jgi:electron transfer flavoprotein beta subunit
MKIYVCVKHVPDSAANIIIRERNWFDESVKYVINPYDEIAVEEAVRVKEQDGAFEVIAVTLGKEEAINTLRTALAMGADRGILIKAKDVSDSIITARALTAVIEQDGRPDIIFTGKESIDSEGMQTMYRIAAALDIPSANNVVVFSMNGGRVTVECELEAGVRQVVEMGPPCLVGAGKGLNTPRYIKIPDVMKARRKQVDQVDLDSLNFEKPSSSLEMLELETAFEKRRCEIFKGQPEEVVRQLVQVIRGEGNVF